MNATTGHGVAELPDSPSWSLPDARWHRPLLGVAAVMVGLVILTAVMRFTDPRELGGVPLWDKPLKFAASTLVYSVTWSWLIGQVPSARRRVAHVFGTVISVALAIELAVIGGAAASGMTSHFNVSTPLATALWSIMATSITVLWIATFLLTILLLRAPLGDRARVIAIRAGAVISLVGLGLGYLMTSPTAAQLADFQGIAGAHAVGVPDGGVGLPVLGWSTVAGDLRIPHFVGMHALQVLPLFLVVLELAARRVVVLRGPLVRARLVEIASLGYAASVVLVTVQALRGQSIVAPDAVTIAAASVIGAGMIAGAHVVLRPQPVATGGQALYRRGVVAGEVDSETTDT